MFSSEQKKTKQIEAMFQQKRRGKICHDRLWTRAITGGPGSERSYLIFIVIETLGLFSWNFVKKNNQKCHVTLACFFEHFAIQPTRKVFKNHPGNMVDGRNLAPVNIVDIP